ncbi:MAG TPA: hypothetical protein VGJ95_00220, partial [Pseudonocardiaceae bacterium]
MSGRPAPRLRPALPAALRRPMAAVAVAAAAVLIALGVLYAAGGSLGVLEAWVPTPTRLRPPWLDAALVVDFGGERLGAA